MRSSYRTLKGAESSHLPFERPTNAHQYGSRGDIRPHNAAIAPRPRRWQLIEI